MSDIVPTTPIPTPASTPAPSTAIAFDPPDTTAASAAYALTNDHPVSSYSGAHMPELPASAQTRQAIHDRIALIATRCELMLIEHVDRMAVRGLLDDQDLRKFEAVTLFLYRLMSVRKSLDQYLHNAPNAPDSPAITQTLTNAMHEYHAGSAGVLARNTDPAATTEPDQQTNLKSDHDLVDDHESSHVPCSSVSVRVPDPQQPTNTDQQTNLESRISNLKSDHADDQDNEQTHSQPSSTCPSPLATCHIHSQPTTHNSQPIRSVPTVPTLPLTAIIPYLDKISTTLANPESVLNAKPQNSKTAKRQNSKTDKYAESEKNAARIRKWNEIRPDPNNTPTDFRPQRFGPDSPYQPKNCPDCANCATGLCYSRIAAPNFVTCDRDCYHCPYNFECPWVPQKYRTNPPYI